ncbi:MAG: leucyl aminopeptidase family protein [Pseudomonadota bacterium]
MTDALIDAAAGAIPLHLVDPGAWSGWRDGRDWLDANGFKPEAGRAAVWPDAEGRIAGALVVAAADAPLWTYGGLSTDLPAGDYVCAASPETRQANALALGWSLGAYRFRETGDDAARARLVWPAAADRARVAAERDGVALARDLINTPANALGPEALAAAAEKLAAAHGAQVDVIVGDALIAKNFPLIHAVGRAAAEGPRLVDIRWGPDDGYPVTLVGKGVCFDTGGLDLKPAAAMRLMKKDMGGAANTLGLAAAIMALKLPVKLRVLIPCVENSVSASAFRPGDVLTARNGLTIEIGNTDAEGRLVLADALSYAMEEAPPKLLVDMATLTGAARVALGPELPALFCDDDHLAHDLLVSATANDDPLWLMPLHRPYAKMLSSKVADLNNAPDGPFAGAVTAALFLQRFVSTDATTATAWAHIDLYAWNNVAKPGRPEGGEAMGLRALLAVISDKANR